MTTRETQRLSTGYLEILKTNHNFRRIWIATLVSLLGDWFNTIALYTLISRLTVPLLPLAQSFCSRWFPSGSPHPWRVCLWTAGIGAGC